MAKQHNMTFRKFGEIDRRFQIRVDKNIEVGYLKVKGAVTEEGDAQNVKIKYVAKKLASNSSLNPAFSRWLKQSRLFPNH